MKFSSAAIKRVCTDAGVRWSDSNSNKKVAARSSSTKEGPRKAIAKKIVGEYVQGKNTTTDQPKLVKLKLTCKPAEDADSQDQAGTLSRVSKRKRKTPVRLDESDCD
jgi:hypothetical protein